MSEFGTPQSKEPIELAMEQAERIVEEMIRKGHYYAYVNGQTGRYSSGLSITEFPATVRFNCFALQPDPNRSEAAPLASKKEFVWLLTDCIMAGKTLTDISEELKKIQ